jgi:hypothetical protein
MRSTPSRFALLPLLAALACSGTAPVDHGNAAFSVRESIGQLHMSHATAGHTLTALDGAGAQGAIDTPGDSRKDWRFRLVVFPQPAHYWIGRDAAHPSSVVLPALAGVTAPTALPPCAALRGQQCRAYVAYANVAAAP